MDWSRPPVDLVRDLAAESSYSFCVCVPHRQTSSNVSRGGTSESHLGDGDSVQGNIELTIAAAVEAVTFMVAPPDWNRRCAVVHGKGRARAEATHVGGLCDQLGSGQAGANGHLSKAGASPSIIGPMRRRSPF